ncbi:MAG: hypothetical protein IPL75_02545 [Acidobacteria bacterium]|nr:hypothetical protein [Acidobacteriota bacterium]
MSIDVCYVFSNGFGTRMILQSGVVPHLRSLGISIAVVSPNAEEPSLQELARRQGILLEPVPKIGGRRMTRYHRMRRYMFEDIRQNPSIWARHMQARANPPKHPLKRLRQALYYPMNRASVRFPWFRQFLKRMEARALQSTEMSEMLNRLRPRVAVATYPIDALDSCFLHEARQLGIHTVGHLMSWDNVTTKGRFPIVTDSYISWGPIMTDELRQYYDIPAERIHECGVAHFDLHVQAPARDRFVHTMAGLGLDPDKPYLFFGMTTPNFSAREIEIVEWLAGRVRSGAFGADMQLVVRQHPQNAHPNADPNPRLRRLQGNRVGVHFPGLEESRLRWNLLEADLQQLASLIAGCTVSFNSGSTLTIDAIVRDKPVVVTAFDVGEQPPWWASAGRVLGELHFKKLTALGGVRVAHSLEELEATTRAYLADPALDARGRAATRQAECGACDGQASERIANALAEICRMTSAGAGVQA